MQNVTDTPLLSPKETFPATVAEVIDNFKLVINIKLELFVKLKRSNKRFIGWIKSQLRGPFICDSGSFI